MKTQTRIALSIITFAIILVFGLFLAPSTTGRASSPASLALGRTVVPEGDDFATRTLGLPWNMNGSPYPDYLTALKNIDRDEFEILGSGAWHLVPENTDPRVWLHWPGVGTTQAVLRMGDTRPIDAEKYRLLSYYMCLDDAPNSTFGQDEDWAAKVYWFYDRSPNTNPANGSTNFAFFKQQGLFENDGDCELMTIDLTQPSAWADGTWNNDPKKVMGLRLDPINKEGKSFDLGWVRLTTFDSSNTVPLSWSNAPAGEIEFYVTQAACGVDGILVGTHPNPTGSGTFEWGAQLQPGYSAAHPLPIPESFEPGTYQVYLKDVDGEVACAGDALKVHGAPILEFQSPSPYSGTDYASIQVNDPWGMSNTADVKSTAQIASSQFSNGVLTATTSGTDPRLTLNVGSSIDTEKYRFVTFRMKVEGENSVANGWVQRFIWWWVGPTVDNVTTQDLELYEGWHTYTLDLKTAAMEVCGSENCWNGSPTGFRFDPVESPANTTFMLDFLVLTAIETVTQGVGLKVHYTLPNSPDAEVVMYLDTDLDPMNGRITAPQMPDTPVNFDDPNAVFKLFLPLLSRPGASLGELNFYEGSLWFTIDTGDMAPDTYYISADVFDGEMTTTWYSETPVIIE